MAGTAFPLDDFHLAPVIWHLVCELDKLRVLLQRSEEWFVRVWENLITALAYLFWLALIGSCLAMFCKPFFTPLYILRTLGEREWLLVAVYCPVVTLCCSGPNSSSRATKPHEWVHCFTFVRSMRWLKIVYIRRRPLIFYCMYVIILETSQKSILYLCT